MRPWATETIPEIIRDRDPPDRSCRGVSGADRQGEEIIAERPRGAGRRLHAGYTHQISPVAGRRARACPCARRRRSFSSRRAIFFRLDRADSSA